MGTAKKIMVIGLDAIIARQLYRYARAGHMPCVKRLLDNGVFGNNCLPPFPGITPPNWSTLATGATAVTHNITCFNVHTPGDELTAVHQGFDSGEMHAEYIWEAVEKVGKKAIVVNYPTSWPPRMEQSIQIGGMGLHPNEWRTRDVPQWEEGFWSSLAYDQLWASGYKTLSTDLELRPARKWENAPASARALEGELAVEYRKAKTPLRAQTWQALVLDSEGQGFDRVIVAESKDCAHPLADLKLGQWSETIVREFQTAAGSKKAAFRLKLVELSPDGETVSLYRTSLCALDGWEFPRGVAADLPLEGLPLPYPGFLPYSQGWFDIATLNEIVELSHVWLAAAADHLLTNHEWDIFYMHIHTPDTAYHAYANFCDRQTAADEAEYNTWHPVERFMYESLDRAIARITRSVDVGETVILLTSDHGAKPTGAKVYPGQILADAGITVFLPESSEVESDEPAPAASGGRGTATKVGASGDLAAKFEHFGEIDWSRTRAIVQRSCHVFISLKGRNPLGIVDPADYAKVQEEIIAAFYNYTDPRTGKKPIAFAFKREDARVIFMGGEQAGDVVYGLNPEFYGQHGGFLGTARYGEIGDLRTLFLLSGPGVKKGQTIDRTIWLQDVVPTLCYLADLPVPADCEGAIVYQALEDPNQKLNELQAVKRRYEKMRQSLDRAPMC